MEITDYPTEESFRILCFIVCCVSLFLSCLLSVVPFFFFLVFFGGGDSKFVFQSFKFLALFSCCASDILDFELSPDM